MTGANLDYEKLLTGVPGSQHLADSMTTSVVYSAAPNTMPIPDYQDSEATGEF